MSVLLTVDQFKSDAYMGSTGTKPANAVQVAIDLAEGDVSEALGFPLDDGAPTFIAQQVTEEYPWPHPNRPLLLTRPRVVSVDTVLARHDAGTCDCAWTDLTACAFLLDAKVGIVHFRSCAWAGGCWVNCRCPQRIQITYTAGFAAADLTADQPAGRRLRLAIALQARAHLELTDFYSEGNAAVSSYSSLGYSEKREFVRSATGRKLGLSALSQAAADVLRPLIVRRGGGIIARSQ
jgi:hypothetical protein